MKPKSSTLFHFTRSIDFLQSILKNGFMPRYCLEDTRWFGLPSIDVLAYPMSCFCDIPLSRIAEHTGFYGSYGIGMTKDWGLRNSLAPVIYSPPKSSAPRAVEYIMRSRVSSGAKKANTEKAAKEAAFGALLAFIKPLSGQMMIGGVLTEKEFYQESEWRYVPSVSGWDLIMLKETYEKERDKRNAQMGDHAARFTPQDVRYIFVAREHEIPGMFDFITNDLGHYPHNDVKLLTTRIVSLESLTIDL